MARDRQSGILAVDKGQIAVRSLGLNKFQTMRYIIIPQAFTSILPPLPVRIYRVLIEETSIVGYVGIVRAGILAVDKGQMEAGRSDELPDDAVHSAGIQEHPAASGQ